jgi:hypothetical protein
MAFTSMIKELVLPVSGQASLETAIVAQVATYVANSYQIFDLSCYAESGELCVVGNILTTTNDPDYTVPFYAVNTAGQDVANPTWVVSALDYDVGVTFSLQEENAGLYSLVEIPSTSTNWGKGWVAVGMTGDKTVALEFAPVIVHIGIDGTLTNYASPTGTFPPNTWEFTDQAGTVPSDEQPYALCDVVYDKMNDALVAVGSIGGGVGSPLTYTLVVEAIRITALPTIAFSTQYGIADVAPYSAFGKSCAIQTQDPSGAEVANRTIVSICGFSQDSLNIGNTAYASWLLYQPNFSNPFGGVGFNPRFAWIATGKNRPADYWDASGLFPSNDDRPNYLNIIERLTADGEDIYFLGGNCPLGLFGYTFSGLTTDSTGGGNDNIINTAGAGQTVVNFAEQKIVSSQLQTNTILSGSQIPDATAYYPTDILAIGKNNGNSGRRTKVYSIGGLAYGRFCPFPVIPNLPNTPSSTWIFAVSRGFKLFQEDISENSGGGVLGINRSKTLAMCPRTNSEKTRIIFSESSFNPTGTGLPSSLVDVAVATGNAAYAWFEYLLYDGVDALIARKLNEMGVRVTIANVEWYKQDILKQGLDVSTDFFNEWGELQIEENKQRERVAEQFGRKRSPKRQVRTELFDDYADYEDKESQIKEFPDYDPAKDGNPFKDDVALEQEREQTQKAVDDLRRIEDLVEDENNDEAEYDDEADVSDWGEN